MGLSSTRILSAANGIGSDRSAQSTDDVINEMTHAGLTSEPGEGFADQRARIRRRRTGQSTEDVVEDRDGELG
jgi:hypothetical protein